MADASAKTSRARPDAKAGKQRRRPLRSAAPTSIPAEMRSALPAGGRSLPGDVRTAMEERFGESFEGVVLHDGLASADLAMALRARAYTLGEHIVFGAGRFAPQSAEGRRLLSHELAHVVQQRRGGPYAGISHEADADRASAAVSMGGLAQVATGAAPGIQCAPMTADEIARANEQQLRSRLTENEREYSVAAGSESYYKALEAESQLLQKAIRRSQRMPAAFSEQKQTIAPKAADRGPSNAEPKYVLSNQPLDPDERAASERRNRDNHRMLQMMAPGLAADMMKEPWYAKSMGIYAEDPAEHAVPSIPGADQNVQAPIILDMSSFGKGGKKQIGGSPEYWSSARGKARLKLQDDMRSLKSRLERMQGVYKDVVQGSIVIRNVIEAMGGVEPPSAAKLNKVFALLAECEKQIDNDGLEGAAKNCAQAGAMLREFEWYWSRYTDYLEIGGKNTIQSLEMVRDTSKYSLMVLSAGGGAAVTAVGAIGSLAIDTTEAATNAALGEPVDWVHFSLKAALDLLLAKYGGAIARGFVAKLIKTPAFAKLGESALFPLVHVVLNGAEVRSAYALFNGLYKGDLTWGKLKDAVFDPNGIMLDVVLGGVSARLKQNATAKPSEPAPKPPAAAAGSTQGTNSATKGVPSKANAVPNAANKTSPPGNESQAGAQQATPFQGGKRPPVSEKTSEQKKALKDVEPGSTDPIPINRGRPAPPQKLPPNEPQAMKREATNDAPVESKPGPKLEVVRGGKSGPGDGNQVRASAGESSGGKVGDSAAVAPRAPTAGTAPPSAAPRRSPPAQPQAAPPKPLADVKAKSAERGAALKEKIADLDRQIAPLDEKIGKVKTQLDQTQADLRKLGDKPGSDPRVKKLIARSERLNRELSQLQSQRAKPAAARQAATVEHNDAMGIVNMPAKGGGSHGDVRGRTDGGEVNHIPAWDSYKGEIDLGYGEGPGVWMTAKDHGKLKSTGSSADAVKHRAKQRELISQGRFDEAVEMDVSDIKQQFPDGRYDDYIVQMRNYISRLDRAKLKPRGRQ